MTDSIHKLVKLTIDSPNLNLQKMPTHVRITNQYVDINDTHLITSPFVINQPLVAGEAVIDLVATTNGSVYEVTLLCRGEPLADAYFFMPPTDKRLSELDLFTAYPPKKAIDGWWKEITAVFDSIKAGIKSEFERIITEFNNIRYRMVTVTGDYTLQAVDFDGKTIIRVASQTPCVVSVPADVAPLDFTGRSVTIRNVSINPVTIMGGAGVVLYPADGVILRRGGSTATLIYASVNAWDIYGEMP